MAQSPSINRPLQRFEVRSADALLEILDSGNVGLWEWNVQTGDNLVTPAWAAQLGYTMEAVAPVNFATFINLIHEHDRQQVETSVQAHLAGDAKVYQATFRMRRKDDSWAWIEARGQVTAWTAEGEPLLMAGTHLDISNLKAIEEELRNRSNTDAMTGWFNRAHFLDAGNVTVSRALRQKSRLALVMFDIDHFKSVNDRFGHAMGDQVIETITSRIADKLRKIDVPARMGGEEFAILLDGAALGDARRIAEVLRQSIESTEFTPAQGSAFNVTASFGVTMIDDHKDSIESMLSRADSALYQAKAYGRNRTELA